MLFSLFSDPLPPGAPAPPFICEDDTGELFQLSLQRGRKVILVFYPADWSPACTRQLCLFRDRWNYVRSRGAVVYGVNPASRESHEEFRARHRFPFPLLVDAGGGIARHYNAAGRQVRRTVYLIDECGIIRFSRRGSPRLEEIFGEVARRRGAG